MVKSKNPEITAIVLTLNEEGNIKKCLDHLRWADRIVLVDSGSTDKTVEYARRFGCDIYFNGWPGFAQQRNWTLDNTSINSEWFLFIDADEVVTHEMQNEICQKLIKTDYNGFYICQKIMLYGKWVKRSSGFPVWHPRIGRMGKVRFKNAVTEHGETWDVEGKVGYIRKPCIHYSFSKGLNLWFQKHNRLAEMECVSFFNKKNSFIDIIHELRSKDFHRRRQAMRAISYRLPFRPFLRFLYQLVFKGGILDGPAGWKYCTFYLAYEIMISAKIKEKKYLIKKIQVK